MGAARAPGGDRVVQQKRVNDSKGGTLVTGGSGFLGRHVLRSLISAGESVTVLARNPQGELPTVIADLGRGEVDLGVRFFQQVFHLAGLAHRARWTAGEREGFFAVNLDGTKTLLGALERSLGLPEAFVFVSTVAVYGRVHGSLLDETTARLACDPYGRSKLQAEDEVLAWGARRGVRVSVVRLPLVAGPSAPGNLGRMVHAMASGRYLGVGHGEARRSLVRAADVAAVLPRIAVAGGVFHLTDGHHPSFAELEAALATALGRRPPWRVPMTVARALAAAGSEFERLSGRRALFDRSALVKMTSSLTFSDERARRLLGWAPGRVVDHAQELLARPHSAVQGTAARPERG